MLEILHSETLIPSTCEQLELEAVFSELQCDTPAELTFITWKTLPNGQQLPCRQTVQVLDSPLLQRVGHLQSGDKIKVCIETNWASKDITAVLKACTPVA